MVASFINDKIKLRITLINLISLLFIFRSSVPTFKYPFLLLYFGFFIYIFVLSKKNILNDVKSFFKNYYLIILLFCIFTFATFLTYKIYIEIFKDLFNIIILLSILFFYTKTIDTKEKLKFCINNLVKWIIFISTFIALYWIYDFLSIYLLQHFNLRNYENSMVDYNFAVVPALLAIVSILYLLPGKLSRSRINFLNIILIVFYLQLFLSSSRRGFIISNLILIIIFTFFFLAIFIKNVNIKIFANRIRPFIFLMMVLFSLAFLYISQTSYSFKLNVLNYINIKNSLTFQNEITQKAFRYSKIFYPNQSFNDFYKKIWNPEFDPYNPDSGWGTRIHRTIYPLTGNNVDIVPNNVKGYLMDNTCNADIWDGNSYSYTNIDFSSNMFEEGDTVEVSVFCFVSDNFNGDWVGIVITNWVGYTYYDLKNKGTWQKLSVTQKVSFDKVLCSLYFAKKGVTDFSSLKGFVIFAYPDFCNKSKSGKNSELNKEHVDIQKNERKESEQDNFEESNNFFKSSIDLNFMTSLFNFTLIKDNDPIRNLAAKLIPIDTVYKSYRSKLQVDDNSNRFGNERIKRWKFAVAIWTKEYNLSQKIFGGGFAFLNWYGYYFSNDKTKTDYPHNPFLYILLYSGIVGIILYSLFLYKVLYYYILYSKEYYLLFIFFLITYFFTFFSGGNPFDPPMMGFFMIFPFFLHSILKKGNVGKSSEKK